VSDIFREVEEDVRRDKLEKFWKQYGGLVIGLVVLVLLAVAGYQGWQRYQASQRAKDAAQFMAAEKARSPQEAAKDFADLTPKAGAGYVLLSRLEQANALLAAGQKKDAIALYTDIAGQDQGSIGAVARIRAGWAEADTASRADLENLLRPLNDNANAWRFLAREILAYSDWRAGKVLAASGEFNQLAADNNAPDSLRNRTRAFAQFLAGGGATKVGDVPPLAPPPAPGTPPTQEAPIQKTSGQP